MIKVELDPCRRAKLDGVIELVELCDENGRTVGYFLSSEEYERLIYTALAAEGPHSPEELMRLRNETGGHTLKEIWQSLGRNI